VLVIFVGAPEAINIAMALTGRTPPRSMAHHLMASIVQTLGARLEAVLIPGLDGSTFLATVQLRIDGRPREVDARPSDAIALALTAKCPVHVDEAVMERVSIQLPETAPVSTSTVRGAAEILQTRASALSTPETYATAILAHLCARRKT